MLSSYLLRQDSSSHFSSEIIAGDSLYNCNFIPIYLLNTVLSYWYSCYVLKEYDFVLAVKRYKQPHYILQYELQLVFLQVYWSKDIKTLYITS